MSGFVSSSQSLQSRGRRVASDGVAILMLSPAAYADLLPSTLWKEEEAWREMAPYIEAGYHGPIPLALIDELIELEVIEKPDPLLARLAEGRCRVPPPRVGPKNTC
jgi:hypothetical protein